MTDIHCHILPGVDDGAENAQTSVLMAAMAADDGIKKIIATPHFDAYAAACAQAWHERVSRLLEIMKEKFKESGFPVSLFPGAEVLCTPETMECLRTGSFPTLAGSRYALVEFFFEESRSRMDQYLQRIADAGLIPVIAHPERYRAVQREYSVAADWRGNNCLIQVNKGSLSGVYGVRARRAADRMLSDGLADFVASDAHNIHSRNTSMRNEYAHVAEKYGKQYANRLFKENAEIIFFC